MDAAAKQAAVDSFLEEYPHLAQVESGHPVLRECADFPWSRIPGCPTGVAVLFQGLFDPLAALEAERVLTNILLDGIVGISALMPAALPFLLRLANDADVQARVRLVVLVVVAAELSQPIDAGDELMASWFGTDSPERAECRAVFTEHASLVHALLHAGLPESQISADQRASLLLAVEGPR